MIRRHRQLFLDLDGVFADLNGAYQQLFGVHPDDTPSNTQFWKPIIKHQRFFAELPLLPDALAMWEGALQLHAAPVILTGRPLRIPQVEEQKRAWVRRHLSKHVTVVCCESHSKSNYCLPGDVLVDDQTTYKHLWENMGGIYIVHTSAAESLKAAAPLFTR